MKKIRVMIVEDSAVVSALLEYSIGGDPRLEVCAMAANAEDALAMLDRVSPDVIAMDIRLPGMDGLEATRRIMSKKPVPIVVVASSIESGKWNTIPMEALRAGALTVLEKPSGTSNAEYRALAERLCTQLAIMSQVKLVRRNGYGEPHAAAGRPALSWRGRPGAFQMLGIVCSTGGPGALIQLLGGLGPAFPLPILLVQHMTGSFLKGFASWLEDVGGFPVSIVNDTSMPVAGTVHIAPADRHLRLDAGLLRLDAGNPISFQRPSGTILFQSMAQNLGAHALGVLLTGMGDDGAAGLLDVRRAGGFTIAEDESTAAVYGMPAAAVLLGAVCESLPLPAIAPRVLELVPATQQLHRHGVY
jgi:two-component system, chemotaxis family, protein-glutamate methylesterase/glutaminase